MSDSTPELTGPTTPLYQVSRSTLHDLTQCARLVVGQLKDEALMAVAVAIREADAEIKRRDAPPMPVDALKE